MAAAMMVWRSFLSLSAAAAAELCCSLQEVAVCSGGAREQVERPPVREGGMTDLMRKTRSSTGSAADRVKGTGRRMLRFESIDQMMGEVDRLVEAERAGLLQMVG